MRVRLLGVLREARDDERPRLEFLRGLTAVLDGAVDGACGVPREGFQQRGLAVARGARTAPICADDLTVEALEHPGTPWIARLCPRGARRADRARARLEGAKAAPANTSGTVTIS